MEFVPDIRNDDKLVHLIAPPPLSVSWIIGDLIRWDIYVSPTLNGLNSAEPWCVLVLVYHFVPVKEIEEKVSRELPLNLCFETRYLSIPQGTTLFDE